MKNVLFIILSFIIISGCTKKENEDKKYKNKITGRLIDYNTNLPLSGMEVDIEHPSWVSSTQIGSGKSDKNGIFTIYTNSDLSYDRYSISVNEYLRDTNSVNGKYFYELFSISDSELLIYKDYPIRPCGWLLIANHKNDVDSIEVFIDRYQSFIKVGGPNLDAYVQPQKTYNLKWINYKNSVKIDSVSREIYVRNYYSPEGPYTSSVQIFRIY